ncbi:hypothetical protein NMP99_15500 [Glutamicibacter mishrai]|uniref:hypothetical protein n=1 Tax=Glutamicibacter mishrai TaxID=1775880 RepID=UPI0020CF4468|nr:hypothetical protein [Glutamicibacter mishrai]UTT39396.1 hypothetical protein NMP99_15500 [Glutamicibacter mishrai]
MSLENPEFDEVRQDLDADEPLDGRDSQPVGGSSDAPGVLDSEDPLRGVQQVLEERDRDPLGLNPEPLDEQRPADETELEDPEKEAGAGMDAQRIANLPDHREAPDQG